MIQIRDEVIAHYDDFGLQMVKKKRFGDRQSLEAESGKGKKPFRKDRNGKPYQTDGHYQKPKPYYAGDKTGKDQPGRGKKVYSKATTVTKKSKSPED
ncbi:hypothetical protein ADUPG1_005142, partial [Aduncisulcus paluster]